MKRIIIVAIALGGALFTQAQVNYTVENRAEHLQHIKQEKLRPILSHSQIAAELATIEDKKTRGVDNLKVSTSTGANNEGESYIVINPLNKNQMALSYMDNTTSGSINYPVHYSNDGGNTWSKSSFNALSYLSTDQPQNFFGGGGDPVLDYDKNGNLLFSWIYLTVNANQDSLFVRMYLAKSTNNGATFTLPTGNSKYIAKTALDPNTFSGFAGMDGFHDRQWFSVDRSNGPYSGNLYCSFVYFGANNEGLNVDGSYLKVLPNNAAGFNTAKLPVVTGSGAIQFNNVVVDYKGNLHVTGANVDDNKVIYSKSIDGGTTWSNPITVYSGTNVFGNGQSTGGYIHDRENAAVSLHVDGSEIVHIVWSDFPTSTSSGYSSWYARSTDFGKTFSAPVNLKTKFHNAKNVFMPVICGDGGRISIGAYACYNSNLKIHNYYSVSSDDNGYTWGAQKKVSNDSTNFGSVKNDGNWFGDYGKCVRTDNQIFYLWSDGRASVSGTKMYLSTVGEWPTGVANQTLINGSYQLKSVYPNPASNTLNLKINTTNSIDVQCQVFNVMGKVVMQKEIKLSNATTDFSLDISTLVSGSYYLVLNNKDNEKTIKNFIKN